MTRNTTTEVRYNVASKSLIKKIADGDGEFGDVTLADLMDASSFRQFTRTGEAPNAHYNGVPVFVEESYSYYLLEDFYLFGVDHAYSTGNVPYIMKSVEKSFNDFRFSGIVLDQRHVRCVKNVKKVFIANADVGESVGFPDHYATETPCLSFECLGHFFDPERKSRNRLFEEPVRTAIELFREGKLQIIDFLPEKHIPFTDEEKRLAIKQRRRSLTPPEPGFTAVIGDVWHRPSTVLLWLKDGDRVRYLLLGQDDQQYFGVELPRSCKTVEAAFLALIPNELKKDGKPLPGIQRQGEWFAVPVDVSEVPSENEAVAIMHSEFGKGEEHVSNMWLPVESASSNKHYIHCVEARVGKNGVLYVYSGSLEHKEHEVIQVKGWSRFVKNTAVLSVSQDGVD